MSLWVKIILSLLAGTLFGLVAGNAATFLQPIGTIFISLLQMLIIPLIFSTMTSGITKIPDTKTLGRVGIKTLLLYFFTTLFAITLGLALMNLLPLGKSLVLTAPSTLSSEFHVPNFLDTLSSLVPKNPIRSFAEGNVLQVIIFSLFFGVSIAYSKEKGKQTLLLVDALAATMQQMTIMVMKLTPIGVFAIMAHAIGTNGLYVLMPVLKFLAFYWIASLLHVFIVFGSLLKYAKTSIKQFISSIAPAISYAVSTCSSLATLPVSLQCATERLKLPSPLTQFVLPLGCSLNMNGSALYQAMSAVFLAQAYGIELHAAHYITIISTVILATLGTASIPGGGFLMLSIVSVAIGIPQEGLALLMSIDRLRDMATTVLNISGDIVCAQVIAFQESSSKEILTPTTLSAKEETELALQNA